MITYLITQGLTRGESKVVEKVLDGKSNKEIAEELFISEKTVKFHLTKTFRKLNVISRSQLMVKFLVISPVLLMTKLNNNPLHGEQNPKSSE